MAKAKKHEQRFREVKKTEDLTGFGSKKHVLVKEHVPKEIEW